MTHRDSTATILVSGDADRLTRWLDRSWRHLTGSRLILVSFGKTVEQLESITSRAPEGTELLPPRYEGTDDTSLEANRNAALTYLEAKQPPDLVAFLDDDTFIDPDWLDVIISNAEKHSQSDAFSSLVFSGTSEEIQSCGHIFKDFSPIDGCFGKERPDYGFKPLCPCGNCAVVRWSAIRKIRLHDPEVWDSRFARWQTCFDFGLKLFLLGGKTSFVKEARARHLGYLTWERSQRKKNRLKAPLGQLRSRYLLHRKFLPDALQRVADGIVQRKARGKWLDGYPGFQGLLEGSEVEVISELARMEADGLWRQSPNSFWKDLASKRVVDVTAAWIGEHA